MERAADSVAERGIGCTSQLEHSLNAAAQSMCRELMEALLTSEAATRDDYGRLSGERHGGVHGKDIVTLFGPVGQTHRETLAYVLGDGTGISMFREYLKGVKGRDGKEARTREVKLAALFTGCMRKGKPCRDDDSTTYVATTARWEDFGRMARREFDRRFPLVPEKTIFLTDGGKWLRSVHDNFFPFATMILDIYHALEHLKEIMLLLGYKEKTDGWSECFRRWKRLFKEGRVASVVKEAEKKSAGGKHAAEVDRKLQYFRDNYDRMRYDEYTLNGWFIGSGVVESGCKCVVQQRLDLSGMHWSLHGAEALLPIRALYKSGRLDEFHNWRVKDLDQVAA